MSFPPGLDLDGYQFVELIAEVGLSSVYRVRSVQFDRLFVAKVSRIEDEHLERAWEAFDEEVRASLKLDHPCIVKLYAHFRCKDNFVLILEDCPNGSAEDYIRENGALRGPFLASTVRDVCSAFRYALSQGVQHHDIKPGNIMFDADGRAKLADFRSLTARNQSTVDVRHTVCVAPEVFHQHEVNKTLSSIWSLGMTILWMALGTPPRQPNEDIERFLGTVRRGEHTMPLRKDPAIAKFVRQMLMIIPEERTVPDDDHIEALRQHSSVGQKFVRQRTEMLPCNAFRAPQQRAMMPVGMGAGGIPHGGRRGSNTLIRAGLRLQKASSSRVPKH